MEKNDYKNNFGRILTILLFVVAAATAQAAPGDLDPTFGGTGKVRVGVGGGSDSGNAMARQADGKLVVAGSGEDISSEGFLVGDFLLVRYNANGTPDATFGTGGKVQTLIAGDSEARAVTVLSDGKILAAGSNGDFALAKYNSNGTLDATFGTGGIVTTDFNNDSYDTVYAMAIQPDGKIVLAGRSGVNTALARYNANGTLDATFGAGGIVTTVISFYSNFARAVVILGGRIYVAGNIDDYYTSSTQGFVTCYNANGSPNTAFGANGTIRIGGYSAAGSLVVLAGIAGEEKIIVAGSVGTQPTFQTLWSYDANNGSVDSTFGSGGKTTLGVAGTTGSAVRILNSNGTPSRIFVAGTMTTGTSGYAPSDFMIARYQTNGALDTAFDGDGIATADIDNGSDDSAAAMLIQPNDNKIVVAGTSVKSVMIETSTVVSDNDFGIARFNTNGLLDATFSGDGKKLDDISNKSAAASTTIVQPDGKIIVAGNNLVARFNTDGTFDTTFDEDGKTKVTGGISGAAIQPDGKIVLAAGIGLSNYFVAYRLNADGTPDNTFDGDGMALATVGTSNSARPGGVAIQTDGAIVLAGYATNGSGTGANVDFAVVRFLPNGALDTSFSSDGMTTTPIGSGEDKGNAVAIQSDGKIVVAGYAYNNANYDFAVVRYTTTGALDNSFSGDGKQITPIGTGSDVATAVAIQTNGKIVVAGSAVIGATNDFAAARYNSDGALDTSFDGDGKLTTAVGTLNDVGNALAIQTDGKILIAGSSESAANVSDFAVVRYNTDGSLDSSYSGDGKVVVAVSGGNDLGNAIALDSIGRAVVVGGSNYLFGIVRILGNLSPTAATVSVSGRVLTPAGRSLMNATVLLTDGSGNTRATQTSAFGYYRFDEVEAGQTYILSVRSKRYQFEPQIVGVTDALENLDFLAGRSNSKLNDE